MLCTLRLCLGELKKFKSYDYGKKRDGRKRKKQRIMEEKDPAHKSQLSTISPAESNIVFLQQWTSLKLSKFQAFVPLDTWDH
uniref:Uncharacterized protein n=1 Tax=Romanomermis culicivorax TaxID=13658 RepID=A0A915LA22_ROMCU